MVKDQIPNGRYGPDREDVNNQAKTLALDYIYYRLWKYGYTWYTDQEIPAPQRPQLAMRSLGDEFEKRYEQSYGEMSSLLNITNLTTYYNFMEVCKILFSGEDYYKVDGGETIKWSRIVALYAFGGLLAVECVKNGLEDQISHIADWIYIYVRNKLSFWICRHGGWDGLVHFYDTRMINEKWDSIKTYTVYGAAACGVLALAAIFAKNHF